MLKVTKKSSHHDSTPCGGARNNETVFRYGNYNRYYGYRNENLAEDQRLQVFKKVRVPFSLSFPHSLDPSLLDFQAFLLSYVLFKSN